LLPRGRRLYLAERGKGLQHLVEARRLATIHRRLIRRGLDPPCIPEPARENLALFLRG
jgi:hypothetical protein